MRVHEGSIDTVDRAYARVMLMPANRQVSILCVLVGVLVLWMTGCLFMGEASARARSLRTIHRLSYSTSSSRSCW